MPWWLEAAGWFIGGCVFGGFIAAAMHAGGRADETRSDEAARVREELTEAEKERWWPE